MEAGGVKQVRTLKPGDKVAWDTSQGETHGRVLRKLTRTTRIKGYSAKATAEDPEYLVRSDKTGAKAAHKPAALRKKVRALPRHPRASALRSHECGK